MTARDRAAAMFAMAQRYKREARSKQRSGRVLMEAFSQLCKREGIDPAEIKGMQGSAAEATPWPNQDRYSHSNPHSSYG